MMFRQFAFLLMVTGLAMGQAMVQHAAAAAGGAAAAAGSRKVADGLEKVLGSAAGSTAAAAGTPKVVEVIPSPPSGKRTKHSPFEPQVTRAGGSESAPVVGAAHAGIPSPSEVEAIGSSGEAVPNNPWVSRGKGHTQAPVPAFAPFASNDASPAVANRGARRNGPGAEALVMPPLTATSVMAPPAPLVVVPLLPPPPPRVVATAEKFAAIQTGATYEEIVASLGKPAAKIEMLEDGKVLESLRIEGAGMKLGTIRLVNGVVASIEPVAR